MGSRKRSRPDSKVNTLQEESGARGGETSTQIGNDASHNSALVSLESAQKRTKTNDPDTLSITSRSAFTGATWPRLQKASPSTQIARESILADKSTNTASTVDLSRFEPKKEDGPGAVVASVPNTIQNYQNPTSSNSSTKEQESSSKEGGKTKRDGVNNPVGVSIIPAPDTSGRPTTASSWLGWLGGSGAVQKDLSESSPPTSSKDAGAGPSTANDNAAPSVLLGEQVNPEVRQDASSKSETQRGGEPQILRGSWLRVWSSSTSGSPSISEAPLQNDDGEYSASSTQVAELPSQSNSVLPAAGATWAFWSKYSQKSTERGGGQQDSGQIAITGGPSQDSPAPALVSTVIGDGKVEAGKGARARQLLHSSHEDSIHSRPSEAPNKPSPLNPASNTTSDLPKKATLNQVPDPLKGMPANILLPSFDGTYSLEESPSIIQKITRLLLHNQTITKRIHLMREPPRVKRALAIGIHGLFPAAMFRTVIGQPTGTSIRFANHAAAAIHKWASSHGNVCEVEKVALEGEGKIADRVDNLWKLLLNWIDHVRNADFILVACHSQGVPVAMMLVAKLIEFGVVTSARIGICAMAGVSMGPFADYKSRLFSGSAAELFDFGNPKSEVSKRYDNSLRVALRYGVRISYIGSIDDQLVSLESAVFSPISHPYIYRAVFVDGRVHAPDFISHLVGFALKLRNLGISDHGLIRELSVPLAGSLYTGEGHSRLYDETRVYDLSVTFAMETTSINDMPPSVQSFDVSTSPNPFQLPWSMRGLLEEDIVRNELNQEAAELLNQFHEWKPTTKVLKDVKYRLEAVRSKL